MRMPKNRYKTCWIATPLCSLLVGCVYSIDVPKLPELPARPPTTQACPPAAPAKVCPPTELMAQREPLDLPILDPIPKVVHITIEPGKQEADEGGRKLIENYVGYRAWRKQFDAKP